MTDSVREPLAAADARILDRYWRAANYLAACQIYLMDNPLLDQPLRLATSWHSNRFLNPAKDGAVLPILHLNGWKIANPAILARMIVLRTPKGWTRHRAWTREHGEDLPEVANWTWPRQSTVGVR